MCHFHQKPLKTPPTQPRKCDILLLEVHRIWIKGSGEKKRIALSLRKNLALNKTLNLTYTRCGSRMMNWTGER